MEPCDPLLVRGRSEVCDQQRSQAETLQIVGNADPDLRPTGDRRRDELGAANDPRLPSTRQRQERFVLLVVGADRGARCLADVQRDLPEPKSARLGRQTHEVVLDRRLVLWTCRPEMDRPAVAQDYVRLPVTRVAAHVDSLRGLRTRFRGRPDFGVNERATSGPGRHGPFAPSRSAPGRRKM